MPARRLSARIIVSRSLQCRLTQLETRCALKVDPPEAIAVLFVEPDGHGGRRQFVRAEELGGPGAWHRLPDETEEDFKRRVMDDVPKGSASVSVVMFSPATPSVA
jgi:hypothetical protein